MDSIWNLNKCSLCLCKEQWKNKEVKEPTLKWRLCYICMFRMSSRSIVFQFLRIECNNPFIKCILPRTRRDSVIPTQITLYSDSRANFCSEEYVNDSHILFWYDFSRFIRNVKLLLLPFCMSTCQSTSPSILSCWWSVCFVKTHISAEQNHKNQQNTLQNYELYRKYRVVRVFSITSTHSHHIFCFNLVLVNFLRHQFDLNLPIWTQHSYETQIYNQFINI